MTRGIGRDAAFALLSNRRRRQLLCLLVRSGDAWSLRTAAREMVRRLEGTGPDGVTDEAYRSVYVSLYQSHAPRLAAEGIVDYDETAQTVRLDYNRRTETLLRIVGIGTRNDEPRSARLLGVAAVGAALCGSLAFVDRAWIVPWAALVVACLAVHVRRYAGTERVVPAEDCGDLATVHGSAPDAVDDDGHPDQRQDHGHAE
jgi:hypothetical protein